MSESQYPLAMTVPDAVKFTGLSRSGLYRYMQDGRLPKRKAGKRTLLRTEDLRRLIDELPHT
jgi:predicted DNA-binding transcriptional regulator AlpA